MLKTGFRGERKRNPHPVHILSYSETSPKERGSVATEKRECGDGKEGMWRVIYSISPRTPEGGQAGKGDKPHPYHIFCSHSAHTQLLLATSKRGNVGTGKRL